VLHRGNLESIVGLDKPPGALFDRSIYEFATHYRLENPPCANFRTVRGSSTLTSREQNHASSNQVIVRPDRLAGRGGQKDLIISVYWI
jgi:hypothetical protein